jgi:hypothetical protein
MYFDDMKTSNELQRAHLVDPNRYATLCASVYQDVCIISVKIKSALTLKCQLYGYVLWANK